MPYQDKNLRRALVILATQPNDGDIRFGLSGVTVADERLFLDNPDDKEVLSILMANREFGSAVSEIEMMAEALREMQRVWMDAADELKREVAA